MSNRLTKIYTRQGDDGTTCIASGERVSKDCLLIKAQGDLDELNACLACILAPGIEDEVQQLLIALQHHLFNIGGELSAPQCHFIQQSNVDWLERWIDYFNKQLTPLEEFILPGGNHSVAHCHIARTVCRRAERHLVEWSHEHSVRAELLRYINRLSDLLFVLARVIDREHDESSHYWDRTLQAPEPDL